VKEVPLMMSIRMPMLRWLAFGLVLAGCSTIRGEDPQLLGKWESVALERRLINTDQRLIKRFWTFTDKRWTARTVYYKDELGRIALYEIVTAGPYELGGPIEKVQDTIALNLVYDDVSMTSRDDRVTADFNRLTRATCGLSTWRTHVPQSLAETGGCGPIGLTIMTGKTREYDILRINGGYLYLGERPVDGGLLSVPQRRPTTFGFPLIRAPQAR